MFFINMFMGLFHTFYFLMFFYVRGCLGGILEVCFFWGALGGKSKQQTTKTPPNKTIQKKLLIVFGAL